MRNRLFYPVISLMILLLSSCQHKDLLMEYREAVTVEVHFDWQFAPQARPESMSVYLFPKGGGESLRYEIVGQEQGTIRVPYGEYDAFTFNSDTENIIYEDINSFEDFLITTRSTRLMGSLLTETAAEDGIPRPEDAADQRVALPPDMMWENTLNDLCFSREERYTTITFHPEQCICNYTIEIENITNMKHVSTVRGAMFGLADGFFPGTYKLSGEPVSIPFDVTSDVKADRMTAHMTTFGHLGKKVTLFIYVILDSNEKWYYTFDVTEQIMTAPDPHNVYILLKELPIPKPISNGSGLYPTVDDWETVHEDLIM